MPIKKSVSNNLGKLVSFDYVRVGKILSYSKRKRSVEIAIFEPDMGRVKIRRRKDFMLTYLTAISEKKSKEIISRTGPDKADDIVRQLQAATTNTLPKGQH